MTVASRPCFSNRRASLATQIWADEDGATEMYDVLIFSVAGAASATEAHRQANHQASMAMSFSSFRFSLLLPMTPSFP